MLQFILELNQTAKSWLRLCAAALLAIAVAPALQFHEILPTTGAPQLGEPLMVYAAPANANPVLQIAYEHTVDRLKEISITP